jgi:uncharacterized protein YbjT (DUF2867 family)
VQIAVAGASGFVGRHLTAALVDAGHGVRALTRAPDRYSGAGTPVAADLDDPRTLAGALDGCDVAYYLVHSLNRRDFARHDALAAEAFGAAAEGAGVRRIVYLGGLGDPDDELSPHLRSRQEVEGLLASDGVPVTTLRAGIVIGDRGTSWEIIRGLVERVPALAVPTWANTRTQPIAIDDAVRYLVGVLDDADDADGADDAGNRVYEIGGSEVLRYTQLLSRFAAVAGRSSVLVPVPVPSRRLAALVSAQVLPLLTPVDGPTVRALVESMPNEVVVRDDSIRRIVPFEPMDYDAAVMAALGARARRRAA